MECFVISVSYGAGTNSTAMLVGLYERGIRPDVILFSDTGGELPDTYRHIEYMRGWCADKGFPDIVTVRVHQPSKMGSLERRCLETKSLPSVAFGYKNCSVQYKIEPQNWYLKNKYPQETKNKTIRRFIGIDAGELHRAKDREGDEYPLIDWGWDREACIAAIDRAGIPRPGKTSCFFCPNSRVSEIKRLAELHPDLYIRAIAMEDNAELTTIKGLGRTFSWRDVTSTPDIFPETYEKEMPCGCYDG